MKVKMKRLVIAILALAAMHVAASASAAPRRHRVATGETHSLWIKSDGTLWAAGSNTYGQLGTGGTNASWGFVQVSNRWLPSGCQYVSVAVGTRHSLALDSCGDVYAVGDVPAWGVVTNWQLLIPGPPYTSSSRIVAMAAGDNFTVAADDKGGLWVSGANGAGQLGRNDVTFLNGYGGLQAPGSSPVIDVSAGERHTLLLTADGVVWGAGSNSYGQLATGDYANRTAFTAIGGPGCIAIAAGQIHSLAVGPDGTLYSAGANFSGQLGLGEGNMEMARTYWTAVLGPVVSAAGGSDASVAWAADGTLYFAGNSWNGESGIASRTGYPAFVANGGSVVDAAVGAYHTLALVSPELYPNDKNLWVAGANYFGQLGLPKPWKSSFKTYLWTNLP
jgi:alpha-tubulin suppressor-like RCC1 family protein